MSYRVHFLTKEAPHLATYRLRIEKPAELLRNTNPTWSVTVGEDYPKDADVYVLSKHFYEDLMFEVAEHAKSTGAKIVFDFSTDHFIRPEGPWIRELVQKCDVLTACSEPLVQRVQETTGRKTLWVKDPVSVKRRQPDENRRGILWYGHASNYGGLLRWLPYLRDYPITVVSNEPHAIFAENPNVKFVLFSPQNLDVFLGKSDIVLAAYDETDPVRRSSSTNRVVDAIAAGCVPIVNDLTIYQELKNFVGLCEQPRHITKMIDAVRITPRHTTVRSAQEYVNDKYSDHVITQQWIEAVT